MGLIADLVIRIGADQAAFKELQQTFVDAQSSMKDFSEVAAGLTGANFSDLATGLDQINGALNTYQSTIGDTQLAVQSLVDSQNAAREDFNLAA